MSTLSEMNMSEIELSFFGGSFTGIPIDEQKSFLAVAKDYKDRGIIQKIHLSTRPDYICLLYTSDRAQRTSQFPQGEGMGELYGPYRRNPQRTAETHGVYPLGSQCKVQDRAYNKQRTYGLP